MKNMLANVPEEQRAQVRAVMESKMELAVVKQCITKESLKDMDKKLRESYGGEEQYDFKILKTSSKELVIELHCSGSIINIHTKAISSKRHESDVTTTAAEMGVNKIRTVSEWKSATCPAGVTN